MNPLPTIKILSIAFNVVKTIPNLTDEKIISILSDIGDNNAETGLRILRDDLPKARDKRARFNEIIGHFNSSIEHHLKYIKKIENRFLKLPLFKNPRIDISYKKCFICSIF